MIPFSLSDFFASVFHFVSILFLMTMMLGCTMKQMNFQLVPLPLKGEALIHGLNDGVFQQKTGIKQVAKNQQVSSSGYFLFLS